LANAPATHVKKQFNRPGTMTPTPRRYRILNLPISHIRYRAEASCTANYQCKAKSMLVVCSPRRHQPQQRAISYGSRRVVSLCSMQGRESSFCVLPADSLMLPASML
jgi:hypothetical protein